MISRFLTEERTYPTCGSIVLLAAAIIFSGCGGSAPSAAAPPPAGAVPDEKLFQYEGTGAAKKKVEISRRERVKLLRESAKKPE